MEIPGDIACERLVGQKIRKYRICWPRSPTLPTVSEIFVKFREFV